MKRTLKNFPKTAEGENRDEADLWAEDIEIELRDQLVYAEKARKAWRGENGHRIDENIAREWDGVIIAINKVLGET